MNTGIGDSFNLAHKIAKAVKDGEKEVLNQYDQERRYIGELTKELALINYDKSIKVAKMLGLDKNNAEIFTKVVDTIIPGFIPSVFKKNVL